MKRMFDSQTCPNVSSRITAKQMILERLSQIHGYAAVHELGIIGYSENCLATRLPELAKEGKVMSRYREGKNFKEWSLAPIICYSCRKPIEGRQSFTPGPGGYAHVGCHKNAVWIPITEQEVVAKREELKTYNLERERHQL